MNEKFVAQLNRKIFEGDGGYLIASVVEKETEDERIVVGYANLMVNQTYEFDTTKTEHDKYGEQYQINHYEMLLPKDGEEIIDFLSSSAFPSIGKRTAKKIVDAFGKDTIETIKNDSEKLVEIGIKKSIIEILTSNLAISGGMEDLFKLLSPLGFSEYYINQIYKYTQINDIVLINNFIKENPYKLVEEIDGLTFEKVDLIFSHHKGDMKSDYRIGSGILHAVREYCFQSGDTYINQKILKENSIRILKIEIPNFEKHLENLKDDSKIVIKDDKILLTEFYETEKAIARNVVNRMNFIDLGLDEKEIIPKLNSVESMNKLNYSEVQKKAIINSLTNNISIITGGPGTGKTTIINAVVKVFQKIKYKDAVIKNMSEKIILCAPTGRAAQRMKETTGYTAKTIHSLLEWDPFKNTFNRNMDNPLPNELVIIDEFSMVDIFLAKSIFQAIRPNAIIVIVGDSAQLESVNPGNVLHDLITYKPIPIIHLDVIFRQGDGSSIAELAQKIEGNKKIEIVNTKDMSIIQRQNGLKNLVKDIIDKSYKAGYNEMDVQVLYPKYSGENGIDTLNKALLPKTNNKFIMHGEVKFSVGDKVMQLKNNYDKDIYNGDIGTVTEVYNNEKKQTNGLCIEIKFKEKTANLTRKDLMELTHAYAISIHKSQGSEFKLIVLPISKEAEKMLNKKLLYTAITRAKDKLVIIGDMECFYQNLYKNGQERKTFLHEILKEF